MTITHLNFAKGFRGGESQTLQLILELSKTHINQQLVLRKNSKLIEKVKGIKNLEVIVLKKPYVFYMSKIKNTNILHAHESKAAQFAYFYKLIFNTPYIITRRVDISIKNNFFNKKIYENASRVVVLSNAIKKRVEKLSSNLKVELIPDSIFKHKTNENNIKRLKERFKDKFIIGNIAALEEEKGHYFIFDVAKKLQKEFPNIHFIFLGTGKDEEKYKKETEELSNISFEGFVSNVGDYLSIFDLFVFPSKSEGFGSSILDAMNFNVPVIASNIGGIPDIIENEKNGLLINLDSNELYINIKRIFQDKDLSELFASNIKRNIKKYSSSNIVMKYLKLYNKINSLKS